MDKELAWFWTNRWQQGENAAEEDICASQVHSFPDTKKALVFLHKQVGKISVKSNKSVG
jgi:hypothetical protein